MKNANFIRKLLPEGGIPLPPPTPEQVKRIQKTSEGIRQFLKQMDKIKKSAAKSRLRFKGKSIIVRHSGHFSSDSKTLQKARA